MTLRQWRLSKVSRKYPTGWQQWRAAKEVGATQSLWAKWEKGKAKPGPKYMARISRVSGGLVTAESVPCSWGVEPVRMPVGREHPVFMGGA